MSQASQSPPAILFDLDGVIYRGSEPIPGAKEALERVVDAEWRRLFVTNNSTRTREQAAAKIKRVVGHEVDPADIVTSARAAMSLIPDSARTCLVVGGEGIREAVVEAGLEIVAGPGGADCVVVGLDRSFDYELLHVASTAIREGGSFIATNRDPTFPAADGLMPGAGSLVAALEAASGVRPEVAGKPHKATIDLIRGLGVGEAWVIGDRLDTDIALATEQPDWRSIVVLSGVTGPEAAGGEADFVCDDVLTAVDLVLGFENER
jgi:4-nitrophenyl phosphatase